MIISNIISIIRGIVYCLCVNPTLYGFTFNKGYIEANSKNGTCIVNNEFMNGSVIKI